MPRALIYAAIVILCQKTALERQTSREMHERHKIRDASLLAITPIEPGVRELKISRSESSVGSENSNDLLICHATVSRHHARLCRRWGRWQVIDAGSTNGTYVGGQKAIAWTTLHDGE